LFPSGDDGRLRKETDTKFSRKTTCKQVEIRFCTISKTNHRQLGLRLDTQYYHLTQNPPVSSHGSGNTLEN
jgi:hypothetical protein